MTIMFCHKCEHGQNHSKFFHDINLNVYTTPVQQIIINNGSVCTQNTLKPLKQKMATTKDITPVSLKASQLINEHITINLHTQKKFKMKCLFFFFFKDTTTIADQNFL